MRSDEGRSGLKRLDIRVDVEAATQVPADAVPRKLQKRARGSWRVECGRGGGLHGCRPRFGNIFGTVVQQFALLDTEVQIRIPAAGLIADEQQRPSVFAFVEPVFQGVIENSNAGASLFDSTPRQGARHHPAPDIPLCSQKKVHSRIHDIHAHDFLNQVLMQQEHGESNAEQDDRHGFFHIQEQM